jgi:hypothetical protein
VQGFESAQAIPSTPHGCAREQIDRAFLLLIDRAAEVLELDDRIVDIAGNPRELGAELAAAGRALETILFIVREVRNPSHDPTPTDPNRVDPAAFHASILICKSYTGDSRNMRIK